MPDYHIILNHVISIQWFNRRWDWQWNIIICVKTLSKILRAIEWHMGADFWPVISSATTNIFGSGKTIRQVEGMPTRSVNNSPSHQPLQISTPLDKFMYVLGAARDLVLCVLCVLPCMYTECTQKFQISGRDGVLVFPPDNTLRAELTFLIPLLSTIAKGTYARFPRSYSVSISA